MSNKQHIASTICCSVIYIDIRHVVNKQTNTPPNKRINKPPNN